MSKVPWVEYYRPSCLNNIVLENMNKQILTNILKTGYFPNLLLYGPPGTGKTTTIVNLIKEYQNIYYSNNKELITHLNASDERGIDIIRNQISSFVNTKPLFNKGIKFVILDEVDYMTKTAQQALKQLLQYNNNNNPVRYCLICNYISKIDEGLQNELLKLRFNQLPKTDVNKFLKKIVEYEKIDITDENLNAIQDYYKYDMRTMINFLQSNQEKDNIEIINNNFWDKLLQDILNEHNINVSRDNIHHHCNSYNIDPKNLIISFINYIIKNNNVKNLSEFADFVENLIHSQVNNSDIYINYTISRLKLLF